MKPFSTSVLKLPHPLEYLLLPPRSALKIVSLMITHKLSYYCDLYAMSFPYSLLSLQSNGRASVTEIITPSIFRTHSFDR